MRLAGGGRGVHGLWWCGMGWRLVIGIGGVGRWRIIANRWHFRFVGMCIVAVRWGSLMFGESSGVTRNVKFGEKRVYP